jgi:2-methylfumaryl-CoA hydratase
VKARQRLLALADMIDKLEAANDADHHAERGAAPRGGFFFEDYTVGRRFHHVVPRTLTAGDASAYIALTGARNPAHCCLPLARAMGHEAMPLDDLLVFNVAFGKTVNDISYNAIANLGYADVRFIRPVYAGDTLTCESSVIGTKENSNGTSGIVYVRSRAFNQEREEVLSWVRWVMVGMRKQGAGDHGPVVPTLPEHVDPANYSIPQFLKPLAVQPHFTGSGLMWEDYTPGEVIHHPGGMTIEESDHMSATRLYQNTARIHFDAFAAKDGQHGKRLGLRRPRDLHLPGALRMTGWRTPSRSPRSTAAGMPTRPSRATRSTAATWSSGARSCPGATTWGRCAFA